MLFGQAESIGVLVPCQVTFEEGSHWHLLG